MLFTGHKLGQSLLDSGEITEEDLGRALAAQKQTGEKLGETLVGLGILSQTTLVKTLASKLGVPGTYLRHGLIDPTIARLMDRDEAERRFRAALNLSPRAMERVPLEAALGRTLAEHVVSPVDVPSFDRANVDGFAVVAEDTYGASEEVPRKVHLAIEHIHTGVIPTTILKPGTAVAIATGGRDVDLGPDVTQSVHHSGETTVRIYPGLLLGLQI